MSQPETDQFEGRVQAAKQTMHTIVTPDKYDLVDKLCDTACQLQTLYRGYAYNDDVFFGSLVIGFLKFVSYIPERLFNPATRVLDLGFGEGRTLLALKRAFDMPGWGVDRFTLHTLTTGAPEPAAAFIDQILRQHGIEARSPFDFEKEPLPYPDGHFHLALCQQTIEHLHNSPKFILDEAFRVLAPGGVLLIDTPNLAWYQNRLKLLRGRTTEWDLEKYYNYAYSTGPAGVFFGHTREFTIGELQQMLEWAGFTVDVAETTFYEKAPTTLDTVVYLSGEIEKFIAELAGVPATVSPARERLIALTKSHPEKLGDFARTQFNSMAPTCVILGRKP